MKAYVFPGQGAQFTGMGKDLYDQSPLAHDLFEKANEILGFRITDIMFTGSAEDLRQTKVTQPAIFLHSVLLAKTLGSDFKPEMVAGHSLGEFSALVAAGALSFEDGLKLVYQRALAMQKACEARPSTMAAILGLPDETIEEICAAIDEVVVPANYNCPGQVVISGSNEGIDLACEKLTAAGAKRALKLSVGGGFPFPAHGAGPSGTGCRHRSHSVCRSGLPHLPKRECQATNRSQRDQSQPRRSVDLTGSLDTVCFGHGCRRCRCFHRTRTRCCTSGTYQKDQ